jgi:hypothetical protein
MINLFVGECRGYSTGTDLVTQGLYTLQAQRDEKSQHLSEPEGERDVEEASWREVASSIKGNHTKRN